MASSSVIERHFGPDQDALATVRGLAQDVEPALGERDRFAAELLLSELFTNALRHGTTTDEQPIAVRLCRDDGVLRVEVQDAGSGFTVRPRTPDQHRGSGWGLHFVSKLSTRWGVEARAGTLVWLELDLDDAARIPTQDDAAQL